MEKKAVFSTGRLVLGIIALVLCAFIIFQSCAAGAANALEANDSFSGSSGLMLAIFLLAGGIVGIATRKSIKIGGLIACTILFAIGAIMGATSWNSNYSDLRIWTVVCLVYAVFYLICAIKTKKL